MVLRLLLKYVHIWLLPHVIQHLTFLVERISAREDPYNTGNVASQFTGADSRDYEAAKTIVRMASPLCPPPIPHARLGSCT